MKKLLIISCVLSLVLFSCKHQQDDYFDTPASERIAAAMAEAKNVLESAENGWVVKYYPNPQRTFGGYTLFFKFHDGNVTVCSEIGGAKTTETSLYSMGEDLGPTLTFDTKNSLINYFAHPKNPDGLGSTYKGLEGDFQFTVMSTSPEEVLLRGIKTGNDYVLTPLTTSDWSSEMQAYIEAAADMEFNNYQCVVNDKTYSMSRSYRSFTIQDEDGESIIAPYVYTKDGISLYKELILNGESAKEMTFIDDYYFQDSKGGNIKILTPAPIRSDITFSMSAPTDLLTYNTATINVTPSIDDEYFYIGVMSVADFQSLSEKRLVAEMLSMINGYITSSNTAETVANKYLYKGTSSEAFKYLSYYDDYVAVAFGCAISDDRIVSTTSITQVPVKMDPSLLDKTSATDAYKAWLGIWEVTSTSSELSNTSYTFTITVKPDAINSSFQVTGWGYTYLKDSYDVKATYLSSTGAFRLAGDQKLYPMSDGTTLTFRSRYHKFEDPTTYGIVGSTNAANISAFITDDNKALAKGRELTLSGTACEITSMDFWSCIVSGTSISTSYYLAAMNPYTYRDFFVGPYNMQRIVTWDGKSVQAATRNSGISLNPKYRIKLMSPTDRKSVV